VAVAAILQERPLEDGGLFDGRFGINAFPPG